MGKYKKWISLISTTTKTTKKTTTNKLTKNNSQTSIINKTITNKTITSTNNKTITSTNKIITMLEMMEFKLKIWNSQITKKQINQCNSTKCQNPQDKEWTGIKWILTQWEILMKLMMKKE